MKRLALLTLALLAAPGCVESDPGVRLLGARPLDATCAPLGVQSAGGTFDLNGLSGRYLIAFNIESFRDTTGNTVSGAPVSDSRGGDFITRELVLTFQSTPELPLPEVRIPYTFVLRAGSQQDSYVALDLLPSEALAVLDNSLPSVGDSATVLVTVKLVGEFVNGAESETNEMTYPITVGRSSGPVPCPAGKRFARNGPCGTFPGQDGIDYVCEDIPT